MVAKTVVNNVDSANQCAKTTESRNTHSGHCDRFWSFVLYLPHAVNFTKVLFLAPSVTLYFCLCISGTAERICAKFTAKTCLVPHLEEFECQGQRSKVKVTRTKTRCAVPSPPAATEWSRLLHAAGCNELSTGRPACGLCLEKHLCSIVFGQSCMLCIVPRRKVWRPWKKLENVTE